VCHGAFEHRQRLEQEIGDLNDEMYKGQSDIEHENLNDRNRLLNFDDKSNQKLQEVLKMLIKTDKLSSWNRMVPGFEV